MHLVVPPLRNTTSHVRPAGGSARAGSATNHIVATASPRTRIMSGTTGLGSTAGTLARARATGRPLTSRTADFAADTYATSAVCRPHHCPVRGTWGRCRDRWGDRVARVESLPRGSAAARLTRGNVGERRAPFGDIARAVLQSRPLVLRVALLGVQLNERTGRGKSPGTRRGPVTLFVTSCVSSQFPRCSFSARAYSRRAAANPAREQTPRMERSDWRLTICEPWSRSRRTRPAGAGT